MLMLENFARIGWFLLEIWIVASFYLLAQKKEIEEEVKKIMDLAKSTGNIIFSSSSELHDEIPL